MTAASRKEAEALDATDPLRAVKAQFELPEGVIYLDGNSLGPPPKAALARLRHAGEVEWKRDLIKSWNEAAWIDLPNACGAKVAKIIGADRQDVIVCDCVSANIFKLAAALWNRNGAVGHERGEFPTDGYVLDGLAGLVNAELALLPPGDIERLGRYNLSVFVKSAVHYKTAAVVDIAAWERAAAKHNVSIIWDLSHAAGVIALDLKAAGAKFAVGCGYKFLNGGPGAPAYVYVAREAAEKLNQPIAGWMGCAAPFDFGAEYEPAPGVRRFASGTPPILSMSALDAALDIYDGLDIAAVEAKAKALGDLFIARAEAMDLRSVSPGAGARRGAHAAFQSERAYEIVQALIARGVIGDFRAPNLMRFGFSPLFLSYSNVWDAAAHLQDILDRQEWRREAFAVRKWVT